MGADFKSTIMNLRNVTATEQAEMAARGCFAEDWGLVRVSDSFDSTQVAMARFIGRVELHCGARVYNSTVANYALGEGVVIDSVTRLECSSESRFAGGVEVAALNECGGRSIKISRDLTSQVAYIYTLYRHRAQLIERLDAMAQSSAEQLSSSMGSVGRGSQIIGAGILRNIFVDEGVTIEGASLLSNGALLTGAYVGVDVKAHDFIGVEGSRIESGATLERCFVGEGVTLSNNFTAVDSLFFAMSHCENGEAVSIFAGPYTVSHHKSTLLIAGLFSFFNAGSGSNQSNHLFKCGPVHQGVHMRGTKFGSSSYVMLPAVDGAYTTVIGSHYSHHDTSKFPFSNLVKKGDRSTLIPAANLAGYGYRRDLEKWVERDRRTVKRDIVNFEEHNPYIVGALIDAVNVSNSLLESDPQGDSFQYNGVWINCQRLHSALKKYNKAVAGALGAMLSKGDGSKRGEGCGRWLDLGGQFITKSRLDEILSAVERGEITSFRQIDEQLQEFAAQYDAYAYDYALSILSELLGHEPSEAERQSIVESSKRSIEDLLSLSQVDRLRDSSKSMMVSYGIDSDEKEADFAVVRGSKI